MHPEIHLLTERYRAAELQGAVCAPPASRATRRLRHQLGWTLVEMGLRLVQTGQQPVAQARS